MGRSKNNDTKNFYKQTVRILKRTANAMESDSHHRAVPSYLSGIAWSTTVRTNCFFPPTWVETVKGHHHSYLARTRNLIMQTE